MHTNDELKGVIMVVDDNPGNLALISEYLDRARFQVILEQRSDQAIQQAETHKPDMILLDVVMPKLNGFNLCQRLKANETTKDIPVIFMTALSDKENKIKGFQVGAVDYITKPFQQEEVIARVNTHLTIRKLQQQLEAQNALLAKQVEQLKELNASKDKFISMISHDLQSPFSSLRGLIQFTADNLGKYNKNELENMMDLLGNSTDNLYALIENLLTWSRIQRGVLDHLPQNIDIQDIVAQNTNLLTPTADQKQITLKNLIAAKTLVYADANMVNAILRNLLSNAIKFTKPGGTVTVSARDDGGYIEIAVADTGIGIGPEHLSKLFRIDVRYKRLGTTREKGTGFGLILCKEFIERHGGKIWIESEVDRGTTVKFTVPKTAD
jgi:two-component system sensor histidine kinase/response regulator